MDLTPNFQNILSNVQMDAEGNILVGNNNQIVTNVYYSAQYKDLAKQLEGCNTRFEKATAKSIQYPDDDDFKVELLEIDIKRADLVQKIDTLKREVLQLAEEFSKMPINTVRLRLAKEHFENGDYDKARAVLDAEKMGVELDFLLTQKEKLVQSLLENEQLLTDKANEYLILARLTSIDYEQNDYLKKTITFFETSLKANRNVENLFAYAHFLQENNPNSTIIYELYKEAQLKFKDIQSNADLFNYGIILNNIGSYLLSINKENEAIREFEEIIEITSTQKEIIDIAGLRAGVYNNLGNANKNIYNWNDSEKYYLLALEIRERLVEISISDFGQRLLESYNSIGNLYSNQNKIEDAELYFNKGIKFYRQLETNLQVNFRDIFALVLRNKGRFCFYVDINIAKSLILESASLYSVLADENPHKYLTYLINAKILVVDIELKLEEFENALKMVNECLIIMKSIITNVSSSFQKDYPMLLMKKAIIYLNLEDLENAEKFFLEAQEAIRRLPQNNSVKLDYTIILNNSATVYEKQRLFDMVESNYKEALHISKELFEIDNSLFGENLIMILTNFSIHFYNCVPNYEKSLSYCKDGIDIYNRLENKTNLTKQYYQTLVAVQTQINSKEK